MKQKKIFGLVSLSLICLWAISLRANSRSEALSSKSIVLSKGLSSMLIICSKNLVKRNVPVSKSFHKICNYTSVDIEYTEVANPNEVGIEIQASDNLVDHIKLLWEGSTLAVKMENISYQCNEKHLAPKVKIKGYHINSFYSKGSGDITLGGSFKNALDYDFTISGSGDLYAQSVVFSARNLSLVISGSGDMFFDKLNVKKLNTMIKGSGDIRIAVFNGIECKCTITGSGDVKISDGQSKNVEFSIIGSGSIDAGGFKAKEGVATISGSGDIVCHIDKLSTKIRGSGSIKNKN